MCAICAVSVICVIYIPAYSSRRICVLFLSFMSRWCPFVPCVSRFVPFVLFVPFGPFVPAGPVAPFLSHFGFLPSSQVHDSLFLVKVETVKLSKSKKCRLNQKNNCSEI